MTYRSDASQHCFRFLNLPAQINLSDPSYAATYAKAVAHTRNGDVAGKPIVYAVTILKDSKHKALAEQYVLFLLGLQGQAVMRKSRFADFAQPIAANVGAVPVEVRPWPAAKK